MALYKFKRGENLSLDKHPLIKASPFVYKSVGVWMSQNGSQATKSEK